VQDIQDRKGHIWTGILGMEAIGDALCDYGQAEVAFSAHLKDDYPSLGNMIREGATTLWEAYSLNTARSLNHKMFATPLGWMARYVAGLHVDGILGEGPGFRNVVISPHPVPSLLRFAELDYDSPVGRYHSGWQAGADCVDYTIIIPPNATAIVQLPISGKGPVVASESGKVFWENGKPQGKIDGAGIPRIERQHLVLQLGSGSYNLSVKN